MSVHAQTGTVNPGDLRTGGTAFLDWWFKNDSAFPTERNFESHIYVDDVFVNSWVSTQSPPFQTFGISDWDGLNEVVRLDKGDHTFKLVVDALNQIPEKDETDNVFERTFTWGGDALTAPDPGVKNVNLVVQPAFDRADPIVASAVSGILASGPLTVDGTTYVTWGAGNAGLASTDASVAIHITFDGVVVDQRVVSGLSALSGTALTDWEELGGLINITPGEHTLSVTVDPGNLIDESDETDNTIATVFTWGTGPAVVPDPPPEILPTTAPPYEELTLPNLVTYLPADWDGPMVMRGTASGVQIAGRNGYVQAFTGGIVDYAITNDSIVANANEFSTTVLLDNLTIDSSGFVAGSAGGIWLVDVEVPAAQLTPGPHTLKLMIDSDNNVTESDEIDNVYTLEFEAIAGAAPPPPAPIVYSDDELTAMFAVLPNLLLESANADALNDSGIDWPAAISTVADAAYFLATGSTLADERIDISLLSRADYDAQNLAICLENQATLTTTEYETSLASCRTTIGSSAGLTWTGTGKVRVRVDSSTTPAAALATLLHELGHARQNLLVPPTRFTVQSDARSALLEAQAQVFEAVGMRHIEEFLGQKFTQYPDFVVTRNDVNDFLDYHVERAGEFEEHSLGYEVMWLAALQNVGGLGLADELRTNGVLSATSALAFYNYLLTIDDQDPVTWVNARLAGGSALINEYREITLARVVPGLPADSEGHPDLHDIAFMAP